MRGTYAPTTSLDAKKSSAEDLLELVEAAPSRLDGTGELGGSV